VQLAGGRTIRAAHTDTRFTAAVHLATDRVAHAVGRALKRRRERTGRTRPWESPPEA
jgi:ribosome-associated translation inhibitor RaiA